MNMSTYYMYPCKYYNTYNTSNINAPLPTKYYEDQYQYTPITYHKDTNNRHYAPIQETKRHEHYNADGITQHEFSYNTLKRPTVAITKRNENDSKAHRPSAEARMSESSKRKRGTQTPNKDDMNKKRRTEGSQEASTTQSTSSPNRTQPRAEPRPDAPSVPQSQDEPVQADSAEEEDSEEEVMFDLSDGTDECFKNRSIIKIILKTDMVEKDAKYLEDDLKKYDSFLELTLSKDETFAIATFLDANILDTLKKETPEWVSSMTKVDAIQSSDFPETYPVFIVPFKNTHMRYEAIIKGKLSACGTITYAKKADNKNVLTVWFKDRESQTRACDMELVKYRTPTAALAWKISKPVDRSIVLYSVKLTGLELHNRVIIAKILECFRRVHSHYAPRWENSNGYKNVLYINFKTEKQQANALKKTIKIHNKVAKIEASNSVPRV